MKKLDNYLRSERKQLGLSQTELAMLCGIPKSTICKIEDNQYKPNLEVAFCFALLFQKPLEDIFPFIIAKASEKLFDKIIAFTKNAPQKEQDIWKISSLEERASYISNRVEDEEMEY